MHPAAFEYVRQHATNEPVTVLECGGRDVNGSARVLFPEATWISVDIEPGPGVDIVADFADYTHPEPVDMVVSTEVLEHSRRWREIVAACARNLRPGGQVILTAASHGRAPHSAINGGPDIGDEHYENIDPELLSREMARYFTSSDVCTLDTDVQAVGVR